MSVQPPHGPAATGAWDVKYEFKAVALLTMGLGLVGLDRFIINPLFPVMQKDLGLDYQDIGLISASLALAWGCAAIFTGGLSDRIGRKKVLIPAMLIFSVMVGASGLAAGLLSLLVIRALMGFAEGAYVPASIVSTIAASKPSRIGRNVGMQLLAQPLVGLGLGPILAVGLLKVLPSWHWVFVVVAVPGLILALVMAKVLKNDVPAPRSSTDQPVGLRTALRYPAVIVNALGMACYLTCAITLAAFLPNYLTDHLKLSLDQMGLVMAGQGVGAMVGLLVVPAISDRFGRKPVLLASLAVSGIALALFANTGADPVMLFAVLFVALGAVSGALAITIGPLTSGAVPATMATSATGFVNGIGEILGAAVAPAIVGGLAQRFGIDIITSVVLGAIILSFVLALVGVREPQRAAIDTGAKVPSLGGPG